MEILYADWTLPDSVLEEPLEDPSVVGGRGYTESKWVAEQILLSASKQTDLRPVIVRAGQMAGDRRGRWNEREWFPALIKSSVLQRSLPDVPEVSTEFLPATPLFPLPIF